MNDARFGLDRRIKLPGPLRLDSGAFIAPVEIAYETYGTLNADASNAVLICHALTGDQYVASNHPMTGKPGWWARLIGAGKPIDPARHFIICANVLGSCMGRSEEHTSELQSLMRISYAVFCLKKKKTENNAQNYIKHTHIWI